jgi:hypothetical protein
MRSTDCPRVAMANVREMVSALIPLSAAFSLSTTNRAFGWSASTYQSTSTTPVVSANIFFTSAANFNRDASSGP